ncbi:MAG: flippase-like domain-containing protein [Phycisphaeraceae bacterium]|nr:flippase-like domain-containing protein [Phycisphaeraceae bacterium]
MGDASPTDPEVQGFIKPPNSRRAKLLRHMARWLITAAVVAAIFASIGLDRLAEALRQVSPWLFGLMLLLVVLIRVTESLQMTLLLRKAGAAVPQSRVLLANLLSSFYSLVVPGDLIAGGAKWMNLSAATGKRSLVLNAMVYNRLALLLPPLVLGAVALAIDNPFNRPILAWAIGFAALLTMLGAAMLYHPKLAPWIDRPVRAIAAMFPEAISSRVEMLLISLEHFRALRARDHLVLLMTALLSVSLAMGSTVIAFQAVGIELAILTIIWAHALVVAVRQLPITISGLGVREALLVVILQPFGVPAAQAVTVGLLKFANSLLPAIAGGIYQICLVTGWASAGRIASPTLPQQARPVNSRRRMEHELEPEAESGKCG